MSDAQTDAWRRTITYSTTTAGGLDIRRFEIGFIAELLGDYDCERTSSRNRRCESCLVGFCI
ncbi:MAG: hypothetical protein R3F37_15250 [Candidatus Competibacteraceae bacterium]